MVYESDFYTTRRPYTRPISTSYTVTDPLLRPISPTFRPTSPSIRSITPTTQVKRIPHLLPYIAHKRLITVVHTPVQSYYYPGTPLPIRIHSRVRPSVLAAELQRIRDLRRSTHQSYTASYLNSKPNVLWDDETREIRARADALLRRIHVFVPRPLASDFAEDIVPERMHSDDYIRRLIGARKNAKKDEEPISYYDSPEHRHFGSGNLACVAYTGGKPHSRRRPYYKLADLRSADVQSDVNMLSYYAKNRQAAASAYPDVPLTDREIRKARALENDEASLSKRATKHQPETICETELESEPWNEVIRLKAERAPVPESEPQPIRQRKSKKIKDSVSKAQPAVSVESAPKLVPEPIVAAEPEPIFEPAPVTVAEPEPKPIAEPQLELTKDLEDEPVVDSVPEVMQESEAEAVEESAPVTAQESEVEPIGQSEPEVTKEVEAEPFVKSESEVTKEVEAEPIVESQLEVTEGVEAEPIVESNPEVTEEVEAEPMVEAEPESMINLEVEPIVESEPAVVDEPMPEAIEQMEPEVIENSNHELDVASPDPEPEATAGESADDATDQRPTIADNTENAMEMKTENGEVQEEEGGEDVLQRKLDEDDLRRQVEELKRQAEAEERRRVEEARLAEERWKEGEEERRRREKEERERRLAEIEEQERLEAERKMEEERWEAERIRDDKLAEIQKRAAEFDALLADEEDNRYAIEKAAEEARKRQEREERLAAEVILGTSEDLHHPDGSYNDCQCHPDINMQEVEERPESPDADDDTEIEEEQCGGETDHDDSTDPFIVEHEGFNSAPAEFVDSVDDTAIVEESNRSIDNFWGDSDA